MIAALYVETGGVYFDKPEAIDAWDERRDARLYAGPWPVVAHPPCNRWSTLAAWHRQSPGEDGGAFASALAAVRAFGGVLEHPAYSRAWAAHELPRPIASQWSQTLFDPGWVCEVSQAAYSHPARKLTWLYYVGEMPPAELDWSRPKPLALCYHIGARKAALFGMGEVRNAAASRTPEAFRDTLVTLASKAAKR